MPLITLRQLLDHAAEHGYGVPAFNISNMEQGLAIMNAARACDAPVILQASLNVRNVYAGDRMIVGIVEALAEMYPDNPICLHQDHGHNEQACVSAIGAGFTSAMMDGSLMEDGKTPANYAHNADITGRVAQIAHWIGASIEGELGVLGSLETGEAGQEDGSGAEGKMDRDQLLTDPDEAAAFVKATKVDALAIACGTSHGAYKFTRAPDGVSFSPVPQVPGVVKAWASAATRPCQFEISLAATLSVAQAPPLVTADPHTATNSR